jgi:hypothetical protein
MSFNFQILFVLLLFALKLGLGMFNKTSEYQSQVKTTKGVHPFISLEAVSPYLYMELIAGKSTGGFSGDNGPATSANLDARGVWKDSVGNVYITEQDSVRIRKINTNRIITTIGGDGTSSSAGVGGPLASIRFFKPWSIVGDDAGFFVCDFVYVWRYEFVTDIAIVFAQSNTLPAGFSGDGGPATSAQLQLPDGLWKTTAGIVYIAEFDGNRVRKVTLNGIITTVVGTGTSGFSGDGGPATLANINQPRAVYMDTVGVMFIAMHGSCHIRAVSSSGIISTIAGTGVCGYNGDNIPAVNAQVAYPYDVKGDSAGNIYIADINNKRIRTISPDGIITALFGGGSPGFTTGISDRTSALSEPHAISIGYSGSGLVDVYFCDRISVRRGVVLTPTSQPSRQPTGQPSSRPSVQPISRPSSRPSTQPTEQPTGQPSLQPMNRPTSQPSVFPTVRPSSQPFSRPSSRPTVVPSSQPLGIPSGKPTGQPSDYPSGRPSSVPSNVPSDFPSFQPTGFPTSQPSDQPSSRPSLLPSSEPTVFPTSQPSSIPSRFPSCRPSSLPSGQPISFPTSFPSSIPTFQPTVLIPNELKEGIAAFYNVKDSLNDKSGNGNNGKAHGGISFTSDRFGSEKSSIEFDGNSGFIEVPLGNSDQLITNFTLSFWIYPNISQLLPGTVVFDKSAYLPETCGWSLIYFKDNLFQFSYSVQHSGRRLAKSSNISSSSILFDVVESDWSHITLIKELQTLLIYRDGYLVNSTSIPLSISLPYSRLPFVIGTTKEVLLRNNNLSYYSGLLDDIFIYDRALSAREIIQLKELSAPTSLPSGQPSTTPSLQPVSSPSTLPTGQPSGLPSAQPSSVPSSQPSWLPTNIPTNQPTVQPTGEPSDQPSSVPSSQPSSLPSGRPTNQPTVQPTGEPSDQPSSQPIGFPTTQPSRKPSHCPTSCPSVQPSGRPSRSPSSVPTMRPSSQPSARPSQQPIGRPSSVPSSQPVARPTGLPSVQPSSHPTNQPTSFPSSQPSSQPTKNRFHCTVTDNKFYSSIRDDCVSCPVHSFLNHTGDDTCYCSGGYSQVGKGLTVNCTACSPGEVSLPGSSNCTQCLSGFFANSETNTCELCPVSSYTSDSGQTRCTPCPAGRATATLGSTRVDQCISPIPNFTLGFFALFLVIVIFSWYIVFGKFQRVSFERKVKVVTPNIEKCKQVLLSEEECHYQHLIVVQDKKNQRTRNFKFFFFVVLSIFLLIVSVFLGFVFFTYQIFFTSLILWRGLQADLNLSPIFALLAEGLKDITEYISLPVNLFYFVALPFLYLFEALASIDLNLSSVNVTCSGSQAPIELLINCFILGLLVIIIRSDYQLLFNVLLNNLNQRFLLNNVEQRLDAGNLHFSRYFFICLVISALNAINPFQVGLRYCMGFVRIDTFGKNHGIAHEVTESCNQVPGASHFDSFLGYMSTIFAWWLILPALYCLAEVVVPKCKKIDPFWKKRISQEKMSAKSASKIFPADLFVDETVRRPSKLSENEEADDSEEVKSDVAPAEDDEDSSDVGSSSKFPSHVSSKYPGIDESTLADLYKDFCKDRTENRRKPANDFVNRPTLFRKSVHKITKKMPFILAFYFYCKQKYFLMISVDLWMSNLFSSWITVLKKNTMKAARKEEQLLLSQDGHYNRRMTRIISAKESSVKTPGVKQLFSLDSSDFIQGMHLYDLEQMKKQKKMDSLWEKERLQNNHRLPSYYELCLIVRDELHESILEPFNSIFALMGIGHFFTPTGRYYWKVVLNNYKIFLCVCFGIWTDEAVEAYGLEETSLNLSVDGRAFLYKGDETTPSKKYEEKKSSTKKNKMDMNDQYGELPPLLSSRSSPNRRKFSAQVFGVSISRKNMIENVQNNRTKVKSRSESERQNIREVLPAVISVLICSRVILFQIVPSLVLFATVSMTLASFPLFIFNDFLIETLPALIIYGEINREMAIEKELQSFVALHPETKEVLSEADTIKVLSEEYSWRLSVRGIILFWNESRLLQFIQSSLTLFFSFLLLIYTRDLLVYLIVILGILFWFLITKSLVSLLYLGSSLDLKDSEFPKWLRPRQTTNTPSVSRVVMEEPASTLFVGEEMEKVPIVVEETKLFQDNDEKRSNEQERTEMLEGLPVNNETETVTQFLVGNSSDNFEDSTVCGYLDRPLSHIEERELSSLDFDDFDFSEVTPSVGEDEEEIALSSSLHLPVPSTAFHEKPVGLLTVPQTTDNHSSHDASDDSEASHDSGGDNDLDDDFDGYLLHNDDEHLE